MLQKKVLAYLKGRGGYWQNNSPGPYSRNGIPDIIGCLDGQFYAIELKAPGRYTDPHKGLSAAQERTGKDISKAGGFWVCVDSLEGVIDVLRF